MRNTWVAAWWALGLATASNGQIQFEDVSARAGIGEIGEYSISWLDYNNDGLLDLFVGGQFDGRVQVLVQGAGGRFTNITAMTYPQGPFGYSQGFGDYDNDGNLDFLVTNPRVSLSLFNNNGDGTFVEATASARVAIADENGPIRTGVSFADVDGDGLLDLFVGNEAGSDFMYRNEGNGVFADITESANLDLPGGTRFHMFADIDNDGDADLFVPHSVGIDVPYSLHEVPSVLYRNEGDGTFTDITQIAGINHSLRFMQGVAFFDYDNDGWLDLFIATGSRFASEGTNLLYRNNGDGTFAEVGERVGLGGPAAFADYSDVAVEDYDNDGWLDLFVASFDQRDQLLRNNGDGTFEDATIGAGIPTENVTFQVGTGDYDGDGFADLFLSHFDAPETLLRNAGNGHHWLQVELVGVESNRSAIGARVHLVADDLSMWRQVNGGNGYGVDDLTAAFGLGNSTAAQFVEIFWSSGQRSRLENVAADQRIRVFEGQEGYVAVGQTTWEAAPPDTMVAGVDRAVRAVLRPALFAPGASTTGVVADLSEFGGAAQVPLDDLGDGSYGLQTVWAGGLRNGVRLALILIEQTTMLGAYQTALFHPVVDLPDRDLQVFADGLSPEWSVAPISRDAFDPASATQVFAGASALAIEGPLSLTYLSRERFAAQGYRALQLAFHPGAATVLGRPNFTVGIKSTETTSVDLLAAGAERIDLASKTWQTVEIDLNELNIAGDIEEVRLSANLRGAFYLDDIRFVADRLLLGTVIVAEEHQEGVPQTLGLAQNYPNPFNSDTVIRYTLPQAGHVVLTVYNLAGQQVARLVEGQRPAGVSTVRWDGADAVGRELASGVYLYRLQAGAKIATRKLLLLR
ncbi:MAG: T9SS type A sorting domain-containing protein [Candidatus Latescibacteria bacterium]|nr:T9SS type A sorting domain-containing protein [Candidatus Latescibacterota bacterium]